MRKRVKNTVFFRNLSEDSSADASADAPAIIIIRVWELHKLILNDGLWFPETADVIFFSEKFVF